LCRGRRDRSIVTRMRHTKAATTIQRIWRGAVGRVLADRLWLDINITPMQVYYIYKLEFHTVRRV
jgi:hypothetical protein